MNRMEIQIFVVICKIALADLFPHTVQIGSENDRFKGIYSIFIVTSTSFYDLTFWEDKQHFAHFQVLS